MSIVQKYGSETPDIKIVREGRKVKGSIKFMITVVKAFCTHREKARERDEIEL